MPEESGLALLLLLLAMLAQVWLVIFLYACLGVARRRAIRRGEMEYAVFTPVMKEPLGVARLSRNLSNQFELPVLFYVLVMVLIVTGYATLLDAALAWGFVVARIAHSAAATLSNRIAPRGATFALGFLLIVVLAVRVTMLPFAT